MTEIETNRASPEIRRAHSKAIRRRVMWRERYAVLSKSIRNTKQSLQGAHRANSIDHQAAMKLRALRMMADYMMYERDIIKQQLRMTAYEYVDLLAA